MARIKEASGESHASYQLPVRFDKRSQAALDSLCKKLQETNASRIVRWAVEHYDREVRFGVDNNGRPLNPKQQRKEK